MRQYLLPQGRTAYKANLHSHSTVSDGKMTPEQMKKEYMARGYSIIAYTDHNAMVDHSYLAEEGFLPLIGWEFDVGEAGKAWRDSPVSCHVCFIALDPAHAKQHILTRARLPRGAAAYAAHACYDETTPDSPREYTPEFISRVMQEGRERGFFVTYNHPAWSLENREQYTRYHGMHAMEICNFGCYEVGYEDYNAYIYDDILRAGERIYCIAADDNHNLRPADPYHDSFGGFTMILAEELSYRAVATALERGEFYASMGPEIHELYIEDGIVHIRTSPAARIALHCGKRHAQSVWAKDGEWLTEAAFRLPDQDIGYFRLSVIDERGRHANTNAYFLDTL